MRKRSNLCRGQAIVELAFQIPLMMLLLFGGVEIGRVFYVYHTLQKAVRGGAGLLARSSNIGYCNAADLALTDARNFIVYGNLEGQGTPILRDLTPDIIQIIPERTSAGSTDVQTCSCSSGAEDPNNCDTTSGGRAPDFVVVNLGNGYPLALPFPYVNLGTINLRVSVRMPVTGG